MSVYLPAIRGVTWRPTKASRRCLKAAHVTAHAVWPERYTGTDSSETRVNTAEGGVSAISRDSCQVGWSAGRVLSGWSHWSAGLCSTKRRDVSTAGTERRRRLQSEEADTGGRGRGTASRRCRKSAPVGQKVERKRSEIINRALSRPDLEPARGD